MPQLLLDHLEKQEVGQLLDVIALIDSVMPQGVTESAEFTYYISHACIMNIFCRPSGIASHFFPYPVYPVNPV